MSAQSEKSSTNYSSEKKKSTLTAKDRPDIPKSRDIGLSSKTKNNNKQLSFFQSIEDSDENSNSSNSRDVINNRSNLEKSSSKELKTSVKKVANAPESDDQDDASSTSSCSCEDHDSVACRSDDDLHENLDYDEDSIASSPSRNIINLEKGQTNSKVTNGARVNSIDDHQATTNDHSPTYSSASSVAEGSVRHAEEEGKTLDDDSVHQAVQEKDESRTRIKSFINFSREDKANVANKKFAKSRLTIKDRSHKSYASLLRYFFKDTCYFQIKSINHENVEISKRMGVWSTLIQNEIRLNAAFREHRNVILIFSVQQSGSFQGFARMTSEAGPTDTPVPWVIPQRLSRTALGGVFKVEWLCTKELPFPETRDLYNPFNDNKPVKVARDGQQVESKIGKKLCSLFPKDSKARLSSAIDTLRQQHRQRKQSSHNKAIYPLDQVRNTNHNPYIIQHPTMNGYEGIAGHPTSHYLSHDQFYSHNQHNHQNLPAGFRVPINRRRVPDQLGHVHSVYQPQDLFHHQRLGPQLYPRRNNMRNFDGPPMAGPQNLQALPIYAYDEFAVQQTLGHDMATHHLYSTNISQFPDWIPNARMNLNRFQPYQRSRR